MLIIKPKYRNFITLSSVSIISLGVYILFYGWLLKQKLADPSITGHLPMAIDAAVCFIFIGIALMLGLYSQNKVLCALAYVFPGLALICSCLSLSEDLALISLPFAFGMAPHTAMSFIFLSVTLFLIKSPSKKIIAQWLLHIVSLTTCIVIIGHWLKVPEFYHFSFTPMSIYAAIGFLLISVAGSFVNYTLGITGLFTGKLIGNLMARRLFFSMLIAILFAGYIRLLMHRKGIIGVEFGIALLSVSFCLISLVLIWVVSNILNKAHEKVSQANENLAIMVQAAPYALLISDVKGTIIEVNSRTESLFGYKSEELVGKSVSMMVPENLRDVWMERRTAFFSNPVVSTYGYDDELTAVTKNGSKIPVEIILTPIHTDKGIRILSFVVDITARKANEETIKRQVTELQQKNQELEQFNYISSHDLQEPLRTVSNYINLLEEDYPEQIRGEVKDHLQSINNAVTRMLKLVRSLLEFGKLGQNRKMSRINSQIIVEEVLADLKGIIIANNATVTIKGELPILYAYETELRQLFQNLINNAIKFRKKDVPPIITIESKSIAGYYKFLVTDNGIGIDNQYTDKIFNIFQRLNKCEDYEGHGIGLANCKKIAEMHGGKIWVESKPGTGSIFKFTILKFKA